MKAALVLSIATILLFTPAKSHVEGGTREIEPSIFNAWKESEEQISVQWLNDTQGDLNNIGTEGPPGHDAYDQSDTLPSELSPYSEARILEVVKKYFTENAALLVGPQGPPGPRGRDGYVGMPGPKGERGYDGNEGERGPTGSKGDKGPQGAPGPRGLDGYDGIPGLKGERGYQGGRGLKGCKGEKGNRGDSIQHDYYYGY